MVATSDPGRDDFAPDANDAMPGETSERSGGLVSRRTMMRAAAWSVPVIIAARPLPALAGGKHHGGTKTTTSTPPLSNEAALEPWSCWGLGSGNISCKVTKNGQKYNKYYWYIDNSANLRDWGLVNGVQFYGAVPGQTYGNIVNVYYLPFNGSDDVSVSVTEKNYGGSNAHWTTPVPASVGSGSFGGVVWHTLTGPGGEIYYPWVSRLEENGSPATFTVPPGWNSNNPFHVGPDYRFEWTAYVRRAVSYLYVPHEYYAELNGQSFYHPGSVNSNHPGRIQDYNSWQWDNAGGTEQQSGWRYNQWSQYSTATCQATGSDDPGNECWTAWSKWTQYKKYDKVSYGGRNYEARYGSKGKQPDQHCGSNSYWIDKGKCTQKSGRMSLGAESMGTESLGGATMQGFSVQSDEPSGIFRGEWTRGETYDVGDTVTCRGATWRMVRTWARDVIPGGRTDRNNGIWEQTSAEGGLARGLRGASGAFVLPRDVEDTVAPTSSPVATTPEAAAPTSETSESETTSTSPVATTTEPETTRSDTTVTTTSASGESEETEETTDGEKLTEGEEHEEIDETGLDPQFGPVPSADDEGLDDEPLDEVEEEDEEPTGDEGLVSPGPC